MQGPSAVTVGVFDGVHVGHAALLARTGERARELDGPSVALTFRNHPDAVLRPTEPTPLATLDERLAAIDHCGIDIACVVDFTPEVRDMTAARFKDEVLEQGLGCRGLVLGFDSAICSRREGTVERFSELGIAAERIDRVLVGDTVVSSSTIRGALLSGDVTNATTMLGRPHRLCGTVIEGDARGREIGFPTANLAPPDVVVPARGVYAVHAHVDGHTHDAVANIGTRPTVGDGSTVLIEVHVLDFAGDLYGTDLQVSFIERMRDEQHFASIDELRARIAADVDEARALFTDREQRIQA